MAPKGSARGKPAALTEIRLLGRLAADPEPNGEGVSLRITVTYGAKRHERTVLAVGAGAKAARDLRAGDLVYVVGRRANEDGEHEIRAPHVLARGPAAERTPAV